MYIYRERDFQATNNNLDVKMVLQTNIFIYSKIFRLLYRSFVSTIRMSETSNKNQHSN